MNQKSITEFLSEEYKEFAMYTIENRAIPSVIDGFKVSHRKIIHISNKVWKTGNEKVLKIFQLAGKVASDSYYHHGNTSLESAIIGMAQSFKNNAPLLLEDGQFGSLRSTEAGASRYIGTKLSKNFRNLYKDFELLEYQEEEGELIEPKYFLPIIPTILLNGQSGIAVGFSSNILNRNVKDIIDGCRKVLKGTNIRSIKPSLNDFNGVYEQDENNNKKWHIIGKFKKVNTTTLHITELPPSMTYEKYEDHLEKLLQEKEISSYEDNCKDNVNYIIKIKRSILSKMNNKQIIKLLKLEEKSTEIFSTLDENGELRIFESSDEIIKYFVKFRLKYYHKRKKFMLSKMDKESKILSNKSKFIKVILDGKLKINNVPKSKIVSNLKKMKFDKFDNSYDYLLRMPIYSLTKELFNKIKSDLKNKLKEIKDLKSTKPKDMYLNDLTTLKRSF